MEMESFVDDHMDRLCILKILQSGAMVYLGGWV